MSDMGYLFVMEDGGGWWLKIDSMEKLTDYFEHTLPGKYEGLSIYTDKPCLIKPKKKRFWNTL